MNIVHVLLTSTILIINKPEVPEFPNTSNQRHQVNIEYVFVGNLTEHG